MKVCIREFTKEEVDNVSSASELERYYSLYVDNYSVTLVDVTDNRARKIVNFDGYYRSNVDVFNDTVAPLLDRVVTTHAAPQATVVLDGSVDCRASLLLGKEGLLYSTIQFTKQVEEVESIFLSMVRLDDNNRLVDCLEGTPTAEEPVIMEDTLEHFTSVEDATYVDVRTNESPHVLDRIGAKDFASKHVIFSFIFVYKNPETHPNTTVQFVSLAVEEVNRGMKSTRHAISSAAALIECRAPILSFTGTKVTFLLKPALLHQQPSAWISCFSPISPSDAGHRETFKEAFCVAQLAGRVFSARAGVEECEGGGSGSGGGVGAAALSSRTNLIAGKPQTSRSQLAASSSLPGDAATQEEEPPSRKGVMESQVVEEDQPEGAPRPSIEREYSRSKARLPSEEMISPSEFEAYKQMMNDTLTQLRGELRRRVGELEEAQNDLRRQSTHAHAQWDEVQQLRNTVAALQTENEALRAQLQEAEGRAARPTASPRLGESVAKGTLTTVQAHETSLVDTARAKELVHLVKYHQQEIHEHVEKEKAYRSRILNLESQLRSREDEVLVLTTKVNLSDPAKAKMLVETTDRAVPLPPAGDALHRSRPMEREDEMTRELEISLQGALDLVASQNERLQYLEREVRRAQQREAQVNQIRETAHVSEAKPAYVREASVHEGQTSFQNTPHSRNGVSASPPPRSRDVLSGQQHSGTTRPASHHRAQSFEEFMNDAPRYKLRRRVI